MDLYKISFALNTLKLNPMSSEVIKLVSMLMFLEDPRYVLENLCEHTA